MRKKDREEIQPVIKWIEKSKKWNDWANIEDDGEGDRTHQDEQQSTTTVERIAGPATKVFPQDEHCEHARWSKLTHLLSTYTSSELMCDDQSTLSRRRRRRLRQWACDLTARKRGIRG